MINPFHQAASKLASIGRQILEPNLGETPTEIRNGRVDISEHISLTPELIALASIGIGGSDIPLAFSITGNLQPLINVASRSRVALKLVWGESITISDWLTVSGDRTSLSPPEPLLPGLYELSIGSAQLYFVVYDPAFPQIPLQIEPQADVPMSQEGVWRSPNLVGIVLRATPSDTEISTLCRSIPVRPVSYAKNLRLLMGEKLSAAQDSFALVDQIKTFPQVQQAFIPGERVLSGGDRPGITIAVAIDRPNFEVNSPPPPTHPLLS